MVVYRGGLLKRGGNVFKMNPWFNDLRLTARSLSAKTFKESLTLYIASISGVWELIVEHKVVNTRQGRTSKSKFISRFVELIL